MSLNTYPNNPFPPSTEQMHRGDNEELQAQIDAIKDSATIDSFGDVETALATKTDNDVIAPEFDAEAGVYSVGDLVMHEGKLYEFTTAHDTAGVWNPEEVTEKTVADEVDTLKSGLNNVRNRVVVAQSTTTGTYSQKINALVSAFESLPYDLQIRCFIEVSGTIIRFKSPSTFMDVVKYDISGGKMTINTIMLGLSSYMNKIEITANGTVVTDISATEDSTVFTMYYN